MVKPPTRVKGGLLLFCSEAHREAYIEERAQVLFWEKIREHIRSLPDVRTPAREAEEWASFVIAHASVTSRKEVSRNAGGKASHKPRR
jgi:hypothetical protein